MFEVQLIFIPFIRKSVLNNIASARYYLQKSSFKHADHLQNKNKVFMINKNIQSISLLFLTFFMELFHLNIT